MDTRRNRLIMRIGGHTDYFGNELYALDLNANPIAMVLAKDASHGAQIANIGTCTDVNTDGSPRASHNYFGPNYLADQDRYWFYLSFLSQCGNDSDSTWLFDPTSGTASGGTGYTHLTPATHPSHASNGSVPMWAWDPKTKALYEIESVQGGFPFWKFDPSTNTFTNLVSTGGACPNTTETSAAIDYVNRLYVCVGNGVFWKVLVDSPFTSTNLGTPTGCSALVAAQGPGWEYYPPQQIFVGYIGGNSVIEYDPVANSCTTVTFTGGPTGNAGAGQQGNFGKFRYAPGVGGFVFVNTSSQNAYFLRLDSAATLALNDFNNRKGAAGVTASEGFDSSALFVAVTSGQGFYASTSTTPPPTHPLGEFDTTIARSGAGSARFVDPAFSDDRPNGFFAKDFGQDFGNNSDVYVSVSINMSSGYIAPQPQIGGGSTYLKNWIMTNSNIRTGGATFNSCGNPSMVVVNAFNNGYPVEYLDCGSPTLNQVIGGQTYDENDQNTFSAITTGPNGYDCIHGTAQPSPTCFDYPAGTWVTWYSHIHIGTYGVANSTFESFVSTPTSPAWRQWLYVSGVNFAQDAALKLNTIQLLSYWTSRDGTVAGTAGQQNYDELIVSTQPIMPPMAPPAVSGTTNPQVTPATHFMAKLR